MLDKGWPSKLNEDSELSEKEKDVILLKHLLTWSTWPGFLKFFGKKTIELRSAGRSVIGGGIYSYIRVLPNYFDEIVI